MHIKHTLCKGTEINGEINYLQKTPRKFQFGKKSAKVYHCLYSSTEQLQVALWTYMFLKFGLNYDKCIHTLPLRSVPFHISPSLSLPLQTLRLVSLISLISKTKRIAERSDTNCDTHTQSHTDRQSTLDKYMIDKWFISLHDDTVPTFPSMSLGNSLLSCL